MVDSFSWVGEGKLDADLDSKLGRMGYGAVVRDHNGHVRAARCITQNEFLSPKAAKARATLMALHLCKDMGFSQIQLEGDAQRAINTVKDTIESYS